MLAIVGGSEAISGEVAVHKSTGPVLRKVSSVLILVSYVTIVVIQSIYWLNKDLILRHRKAVCVMKQEKNAEMIIRLSSFWQEFQSRCRSWQCE